MTTAVLEALEAVTAGDLEAARSAAARADGLLGAALAEYLRTGEGESVYAAPAAFEAFIDGGGNVPLYRAVSAALAATYDEHRPGALLDIGCGNGRAVLPALRAAASAPATVELLEPSSALLEQAARELPRARTWPCTLQELLDRVPPEKHWDLAESTFALHTLPYAERTAALARLRPHVGRLTVIDFDLPDVEVGGPEHRRYLAETYERGLAEYGADRDLVAQGFLMPVLVGQLRPGAERVTFEQSAARWKDQLVAAGWTDVDVRPLHDYWSAPAFLLTARGEGTPA